MAKYNPTRTGHVKNARKAVVELGLARKDELAYLTDVEIKRRINASDYLVFESGDDFAILPKECADKIIWVNR